MSGCTTMATICARRSATCRPTCGRTWATRAALRGPSSSELSGRDRDQIATLIHLESPALFVHESVMPATQKNQVVEGRRTTIRPVFDVMRIRPRGRTVTAREPAALVSGAQCTPRRARDHTAGMVGLAVDDGCDRGVARKPAGGLGRNRL